MAIKDRMIWDTGKGEFGEEGKTNQYGSLVDLHGIQR